MSFGWKGRRGASAARAALVGGLLACLCAPSDAREKLTEFDFLLLGLSVRPEPEVQTVPRNTATGLHVTIDFENAGSTGTDPELLLALLPPDIELFAELVGPGLETSLVLRGAPGELLPIPPLATKGLYSVRDIRLERGGEVFLRASPDVATIEVIDRVLITRVETRPLTLEEIRQKGILFGEDSFTGFNFRLALRLDSRPISIDLPVIFDSNDVPVPIRSSSSIDITAPGLPTVATNITAVLMKPDPRGIPPETLEQIPDDFEIPGLLVIPGEVGLLNQFFSALLIVANGAPVGSTLSVRSLEGEIFLPAGADGVPETTDDPLRLAVTEGGPPAGQSIAPIRGPNGEDRFAPGEQGQAEYLLEGRGEGFHELRFDIAGILDGLPVGPIPITGVARGGVLVRNADFHLTFAVPATVRAQEEFTLWLTVTNTSSAAAPLVRVALGAGLSGASLAPGEEDPRTIEDLPAGESESIAYRLISTETGQVTASYLRVQEGTGALLFRLGVGERGVPLSPDTIVLPSTVDALASPAEVLARRRSRVVEAALRVLGQGLSIATAPPGLLPETVTPVSRQTVVDRATLLAEAGFRVELGESLSRALVELAMDFPGTDSPGFDEILRETSAGGAFYDAIGATLVEIPELPGDVAGLHLELADALSSRGRHVLVSSSDAVRFDLAGARIVPLGTRTLGLLSPADGSAYDVVLEGEETGTFDLAVNVPFVGGGTGVYVFEDVPVTAGVAGRLSLDLRRSPDRLTLLLGGQSFSSQSVRFFAPRGPELLAATAIGPETLEGADPWGRLLALLFDREVRIAESEDEASYRIDENEVLSATRQLSGRLVFLFLRDPVGNLVPRTAEVEGLFDPTGHLMSPFEQQRPIVSRLTDPGAIVSGRVLDADGSPIPGAEILYMNSTPKALIGLSLKSVASDGSYSIDWVRRSERGTFAVRATDPATGGIQELATRVTENGEHIRLDLVLRGRGGVEGFVKSIDGTPRPGARVLVTSRADPFSFAQATADGNGFYRASGLVVGPFTVKAVDQVFSGVASGNLLRAGTYARADVVLNQSQGRVSGHVRELVEGVVGAPLSDVEVYFLLEGELVAASGRTDPEGAYSFEGMPTGTFSILAIDRVTSRQTRSVPRVLDAGSDLVVDVFFVRESVGRVRGTVSDGSGPIAGALVRVGGREVVTSDRGLGPEFVFDGVAAGTHFISANLPGTRRSAGATIAVVEGETTSVDLRLSGLGEIVVSVLDAEGAPVDRQQVIRLVDNPCAGEARTTGPDGTATFDGVTVPGAWFKAIRGGDVAEAFAMLSRDGDRVLLTLRFRGFGTVFGVVSDESGPVFGADVALGSLRYLSSICSFVPDGRARQIQTDLLGRYRFEDVPIGAVSVTATARTGTSFPATAKDALARHGDVRELDLELTDNLGGKLSGTVFLSDGTTPAGKGVSVSTKSNIGAELTVTTIADGTYEFAKILAPGRYDLFAHDGVSGRVAKETVFLLREQDLVRNMRLLAEGDVEVEVLDGAGARVGEAFVELEGAAFPFDERAGAIVPSDRGVIRFAGVTEGSFGATASSQGRGGRASGAVTGEGSTTRVTVRLTSVGSVVGVLKTPDGASGVPNGEIILKQGGSGRLLGATTSSSVPQAVPGPCRPLLGTEALGLFMLSSVPAESLLVTATDPLTGRVGEASTRITSEGETACVEVRLLGLGTVAGIVRSGPAETISGARVTLTSSSGLKSPVANLTAEATTGAGGEFRFEGVPVGSFSLRATVPGILLTGTATGAIAADGEVIDDVVIALEPSGSVSGVVTRAGGSPAVAGAFVTLTPPRGVLRTQSGADGSFFLDFVPAGDFTLTAEENGGFDQGLLRGRLEPNENLEGVVLELNGTGTIEGTALDSAGVELASGLVRLTTPQPFARSETATVDATGHFRFLEVPVGPFQLALEVAGSPLRGIFAGSIPGDGAVENVTIRLEPARPVLGRVLREDGTTPAPNAAISLAGSGFTLSDLTGSDGGFRIEGVPLGAFTLRVEEALTSGIALASGTLDEGTAESGLDLGTLVLDATPIDVESASPPEGATLVVPDALVEVTFTDPIGNTSLVGLLTVSAAGANRAGALEIVGGGRTARFTAQPFLPPRTLVTVTVSAALTDVFGRTLGEDEVITFTTGGAVLTGIVRNQSVAVAGATVTLNGGSSTTTDASGRYRFENVDPGAALLVARDGALAVSRVVDVGPADGVVAADLSLAIVGSVTGTVVEWNGAPSPEGLLVRLTRLGTGVGLGRTFFDGTSTRYRIDDVPLGDLVVDVTNEANGDRGRSRERLQEAGGIIDVPVAMVGVSELRIEVVDSLGAAVEGARVSATSTRFSETRRFEGTTDGAGVATFANVLTDTVSVTATSGVRTASGSVSVSPPGPTTLRLTVTALGVLGGLVLEPGGAAPAAGATVQVYRGSSPFAERTGTTGDDGRFSFSDLPALTGAYRVDVLVAGRLRARARDVTVPETGSGFVELTLVPVGRVTGDLSAPGPLSSNVSVTVQSFAPEFGGSFTTTSIVGSRYALDGIPPGAFQVTARDFVNGFRGEASGTMPSTVETVELDVTLLAGTFTIPSSGHTLTDGNGASFRVQRSGASTQGAGNVFSATTPGAMFLELEVGANTTRYEGGSLGFLEESDRELVTSLASISGLDVTRKVYVPADGYFARYLEILENPSGEPIAVTATLVSNVKRGSGPAAIVDASTVEGRWVVVDDALDTDPFLVSATIPSIAFVFSGSSLLPSVAPLESVGPDAHELRVSYPLVVPAQGRVVLLHVVSQQLGRASARAAAERAVALPPELLFGLEPDEIRDIVSFDVPEGGMSSLPPLPPRNGRVRGRLFANDGTTLVGQETFTGAIDVTFQSDHILFRRLLQTSVGEGSYSFPVPGSTLAVARGGFTLRASKTFFPFTTEASVQRDFTGESLLSHSPDATLVASSQLSGSSPTFVIDASPFTYWEPQASDPAKRLTWSFSSPSLVREMVVTPHPSSGNVESVTVLGVTYDFEGRDPLRISLGVTLDEISLDFVGAPVRVGDVSIHGTAPDDAGSALEDLVFSDSAALDVSVRNAAGDLVSSTLQPKIAAFNVTGRPSSSGKFFVAPVPVAAPVTLNAWSNVGHQFQRASVDVTAPLVGVPTPVTITLPVGATVSGLVLDGAGRGIQGVTVSIFQNPLPGSSTTSEPDGFYQFIEVPSGSYTLRAFRSGITLSPAIVVDAPNPLTQDLQFLDPGRVDLRVHFESADGSQLSVHGAPVHIIDGSGATLTGSTTAGEASFPTVFPGRITIRVRHPQVTDSWTEEFHDLSPGGTLQLTMAIPAFGTITGSVRFGDGSPASGSRVEITGPGVTIPPKNAFGGTFDFANVRAAVELRVEARHTAAGRGHIFSESMVTLLREGDSRDVVLDLPKTGEVVVRVTNQRSGAGVPGVDVSIRDSFSTAFRLEGPTDSTGARRVGIVPEGDFTVQIAREGVVLDERPGTIAFHNESVEVPFAISGDATVSGVVFGGDGETPVPGTRVELRSEDGVDLFAVDFADEAGAYEFRDAVEPSTSRIVRALFAGDFTKRTETLVTASASGDPITADLALPISVVKGLVLEPDGVTPVPDATVEIATFGTLGPELATAAGDGSFVFFGRELGAHEILAEDASGLLRVRSIEVASIDEAVVADLVLPPFGAVEIAVVDEALVPVSARPVFLRSSTLRSPRFASAGPGGIYRFERVALGAFTATYDEPVFPRSGFVTGALTELEPLSQLPIELPGFTALFGRLVEGGNPVIPIDEFTPLTIEGRLQESTSGIFRRFSGLDIDGRYRDENLPEGELTLSATETLEVPPITSVTTVAVTDDLPEHEVDIERRGAQGFPLELGPSFSVEPDGILVTPRPLLHFAVVNEKEFPQLASAVSGVLGPVRTSGVLYRREVTALPGGEIVRYLEIFDNPHDFDVEVTVRFGNQILVSETSSGDARIDPGDRYVLEDGVASVFAGSAAGGRPPDFAGCDLEGSCSLTWRSLVVPANGRLALLHFTVAAAGAAEARALADGLVTLSHPDALDGVDPATRDSVVNFEIP